MTRRTVATRFARNIKKRNFAKPAKSDSGRGVKLTLHHSQLTLCKSKAPFTPFEESFDSDLAMSALS